MHTQLTTARPFCNTLARLIASSTCAIALAGCQSDKPPTMGDHMLAVGASHQQVTDQWHAANDMKNQAHDDIRAAQKAIKQAEKDLEEAREDLIDANERLAEGKAGMAAAVSEFNRLFPGQALPTGD